jgi:signal peptidase I
LVVPIVLLGSNLDLPAALLGSGFRAFAASSSSMNETLDAGDRFMVDRWYYRDHAPAPGDLVVIRTTALVVKRVVAVGGDTIESRDGVVFLNHKELDEPYVQHTGGTTPEMQTFGPLTIPAGTVFLMGDNRDVSYDSRHLGALDVGLIVAKPLYVYGFNRHRRGKLLH